MKLLLFLCLTVAAGSAAALEKRGFTELFNGFINGLSGLISSGGGDEFSKRGADGMTEMYRKAVENLPAEEIKAQIEKLEKGIENAKEKLADKPEQLSVVVEKLEAFLKVAKEVYEKKSEGGEQRDEFSKRGGGDLAQKFLKGLQGESAETLKKQLDKLAHAIEVVKEKLADRPEQLKKTLAKLEPLHAAMQEIYDKKVGGGEGEVQNDEFSKRGMVEDMFSKMPKEELQRKLEQLSSAIENIKTQLADNPEYLKKALAKLEPLKEKLEKILEQKQRKRRGAHGPRPPPPVFRKSN